MDTAMVTTVFMMLPGVLCVSPSIYVYQVFLAIHEPYVRRATKGVSHGSRVISDSVCHSILPGGVWVLLGALGQEGCLVHLARDGREVKPSHTQAAYALG